MVGYSGTPLATKLGINSDTTLILLGAPSDLSIELPPGVIVRRRAQGSADVIVSFTTRGESLRRGVGALGQLVFPNGALWIAWPKKASGVVTDVTEHVVREVALPLGLVDNKVCAIDETWTGLRFVWRTERRR